MDAKETGLIGIVKELADDSKGSLRILHSRLVTVREAERLKHFPAIAQALIDREEKLKICQENKEEWSRQCADAEDKLEIAMEALEEIQETDYVGRVEWAGKKQTATDSYRSEDFFFWKAREALFRIKSL